MRLPIITFQQMKLSVAELHILYEQLLHAKSAEQMTAFADKFLIDIINRNKRTYINEGITKVSSFLLTNPTIANISQYAYHANTELSKKIC